MLPIAIDAIVPQAARHSGDVLAALQFQLHSNRIARAFARALLGKHATTVDGYLGGQGDAWLAAWLLVAINCRCDLQLEPLVEADQSARAEFAAGINGRRMN